MKDKEKTNVKILNCNCIRESTIEIVHETLNIKYGLNGTGKTTISKAILAKANNEDRELRSLLPYGNDPQNIKELPKVENMNFSKVKVFDEAYVNSYVFENQGFLKDSFKVFLKSDECDNLVLKIEQLMSELQGVFQKKETLQQLRNFLPKYIEAVKYNDGKVSKRGGVGEFIKGSGGGFENYDELEPYKPFYENKDMDIVAKWAKWRNDGINQMSGEFCPFCTTELKVEKIKSENEVISKVFKNSALSTASAVLEYIKEAVEFGYIKEESVKILEGYIGDSSKADSLLAELQQLAIETTYLLTKIVKICDFKPMNVSSEELLDIESNINEMIIDKRHVSKFYSTTLIIEMINSIKEKVSALNDDTGRLKGLFKQHEIKMKRLLEEAKEDINHFFSLAGFPYEFGLDPNGENKAESYLIPINLKEKNRIENPKDRLSWGERNAFSLVMFMFEAISEDADLIVLDDPITSFDKNKKFAVVRRLFDNHKVSFRNRTVIMFTHDFQPVIDYIYGGFFYKFGLTTPVKAKCLQNEDGCLKEHNIQCGDLISTYKLTKEIAMNKDKKMSTRIVNLRRHIELLTPNFSETPIYEVLSNLIHGRNIALSRDKKRLDPAIFNDGCLEIKKYIAELSYDDILNELKVENLLKIINDSNGYEKIIAIRLLFQRVEGLLLKLKRKHPATYKYVNETNHVENDYIFQLDPTKYCSIPEFCLNQLKEFVNANKKEFAGKGN